ncbi:hypothetical protein [Sphingosinicella soli]|uniref:Uncharacterized protein n=1 Tax=Sphingosinicella soli TaxID=333708 RepID=A0A7W7F5N3_9SPHN|nr:hypothetical protein [Sphingosinicella soli]MBB4631625.1 hypothetical protein [Sphingosinicella soli]
MVPSLDLQLQAAIKALSDTVSRAIDPADKMASGQLHLVIASLGMVRERLPVQRRFVRRLLEDAVAIAGAVNASEQDGRLAEAVVVARAALADPEMEAQELEDVRSNLTSITANLIAAAGGEGLDRFGAAVARGSKVPLDRLRAWSIMSGFEPDPSAVPPLSALI